MNRTQRMILAVFLPLTVLCYVMIWFFSNEDPTLIFKVGLRASMLTAALSLLRKQRESIFLVLAFACSLFSDYFFSLTLIFENPPANRQLLGILGFTLAYFMLIAAFSRSYRFRPLDLLTVSPFVLTFALILLKLLPYAKGPLMIAAIITGVLLCFFALFTVSTLYRGIYNRRAAILIAAAGVIIFASDMMVAFSMFHPDYKDFILWKEAFIWVTYIPGWTLFLTAMADDELLLRVK